MKPINALLSLASLLVATLAPAAEITLRTQTQATKSIVTLGDVAEVDGADAQALKAIELVPAPSSGRTRSLRMREVQELLNLQGVKLVDHHFAGSASVQIVAGTTEAAATAPSLKATRSNREQAIARTERAIQKYLQQVADDRLPWDVAVTLTDAQLAAIGARNAEMIVEGGKEPWTGSQQFSLQTSTHSGIVRTTVTATVRLPEMVVVPKRPLRKGEVVRAADVELQMPKENNDSVVLATHLDDIVGRETLRSVASGQAFETAWVRKPVMVRRGEVVTVFARASNLTVRMQARTAEEGGLDDIVSVERLDNRQRFTARVIGVQEVEVLVGGTRVTSTNK